ncbi:MAG: flagellar protein FlgN [Microbacteriaceae bacterium]|nr:MAG: flagellar protein FlgN [Microbacteriaceae bacterium]
MGVQELSASLWRERELLELLIFKLEEEHLLLTSGKSRWIQHATREVEQVMERLKAAGLARAIEVSGVAAEWGTREGATLLELIADAPQGPWAEIFTDHLTAMTDQAAQIKQLRDANEQFLRAAIRTSDELLAETETRGSTYDASGGRAAFAADARLFDTNA